MPDYTPESLRQLRARYAETQAEFAKRIGYTQPHYATLETGQKPITRKLALILDGLKPPGKAPDPRMTGVEFRDRRMALGLTQAEMADLLRVPLHTIAAAERADRCHRQVTAPLDAGMRKIERRKGKP